MFIIEIGLYALIITGLVLIGLYFSRSVEEHKNKLKLEELKTNAKKLMKAYYAPVSTITPAMMFFDFYSGRYFRADPSVIEQQIKKINEQLQSDPSIIETETATLEQFLQLDEELVIGG